MSGSCDYGNEEEIDLGTAVQIEAQGWSQLGLCEWQYSGGSISGL